MASAKPDMSLARLLGDQAWMRRLARGLAADDPHAANDAIQEASLAALERPPREDRGLRAWFAQVARSRLYRRAREEKRRARREERAARPERLLAPDEVVVRLELHRRIAETVADLDEPYRTVVFLRYFEDLAPAQIAARQGVPATTVRTWLRRALAHLRRRLDREHGGYRAAWLVPLVSVRGSAKAAAMTSASIQPWLSSGLVVAIGKCWAATLAVLVVLTVAIGILRWSGRPIDTPEMYDPGRDTARVEREARPLPPDVEPKPPLEGGDAALVVSPGETAPARHLTTPLTGAPENPVHIHGSVVDGRGNPVHPGWIRFGYGDAVVDARLSDEESYEVAIPERGRISYTTHFDTCREQKGEIFLEPWEVERPLDLVLEPRRLLAIIVTSPDGSPFEEALAPERLSCDLSAIATEEVPSTSLPLTEENTLQRFGAGSFTGRRDAWRDRTDGYIGDLALDREGPLFVSVILRQVVLATLRVPAGAAEARFVVSTEEVRAALVSFRLRVVDAETQSAIRSAFVGIENSNVRGSSHPAEEDGVYMEKDLSPGWWLLFVAAKGYERSRRWVRFAPGEMRDLGNWALRRAVPISGCFFDPSNRPVGVGFRTREIVPESLEDPWESISPFSVPEGKFEVFPPVGPGRYVIQPYSQEWTRNPIEVDTRNGPVENLRIDLRPGTPVSLRAELESSEALLVHVRTFEGLPVVSRHFRGQDSERIRLDPGTYTLITVDSDGRRTSASFEVGTSEVEVPLRRAD
jgi:RNA polymerase sigma factor (sigma-70 family)